MTRRRTGIEEMPVQQDRVATARAHLADALESLATNARRAARAAASKTGAPDLDSVRAATRAVDHAEETLDFAAYDLATAAGEDG